MEKSNQITEGYESGLTFKKKIAELEKKLNEANDILYKYDQKDPQQFKKRSKYHPESLPEPINCPDDRDTDQNNPLEIDSKLKFTYNNVNDISSNQYHPLEFSSEDNLRLQSILGGKNTENEHDRTNIVMEDNNVIELSPNEPKAEEDGLDKNEANLENSSEQGNQEVKNDPSITEDNSEKILDEQVDNPPQKKKKRRAKPK